MKRIVPILLLIAALPIELFGFTLDKKIPLDDQGFWGAHYSIPKYSALTIASVALVEGTQSRLGKTAWKSLDAGILSQLITEGTKKVTGRLRPREAQRPNEWRQGGESFPSGHVSGMTALITPFILEYKEQYPAINLLWLLTLHQMVGRVKAQAHWQSDVIVGALVGYFSGKWAHTREKPLLLYFNDGIFIGIKKSF